jgi:hypothetical protein
MVLAGTIAYENMGLKPLDLLWTISGVRNRYLLGSETEWLAPSEQRHADLEGSFYTENAQRFRTLILQEVYPVN